MVVRWNLFFSHVRNNFSLCFYFILFFIFEKKNDSEAICIGPPSSLQSYLNIDAILDAVKQSGSDAVHPGYGFLSENAEFSQ